MKTITIGDVHGLPVADVVHTLIDRYDKVIFVGDYTDSFDCTDSEIFKSLKDIISLKKEYPDKVVLLLGNHDLQYLLTSGLHRCSGFRTSMFPDLNGIFQKNKELFQTAFQIKNILWTHAGVHREWYNSRFNSYADKFPDLYVAQQLNLAFKAYELSLFDVGLMRWGSHQVGGPFWCDKNELYNKGLQDYIQIVGHTKTDKINIKEYGSEELVFVDVLKIIDDVKEDNFYKREIIL